ncbi:hypothetical protein MRX96_051043 [Rhipicephalus microplus]
MATGAFPKDTSTDPRRVYAVGAHKYAKVASEHKCRALPTITTYQMSRMARHLATAVKEGVIYTEDLTAAFLDEYVSLTECPPAELLLRSAGNQRFSDFEVLQCNYAHFHLGSKKWPAVGFGDWLRAMIEFQLNWPAIEAVKEKHAKMASYGSGRSDPEQVIRQRKFLRHVHAANILNMERLAGLHNGVM